MIIGSHVHFKNKQILDSVKEAILYKADTFMFYTGAPQNTFRSAIKLEYLVEAKELMIKNNIDINNVICHAPYIVNLANKQILSKWEFSINFLKNEINRCEQLGIKYMIVHPGSCLKNDRNECLKNISDALNYIINYDTKVTILIETMAGKGTECGINTLEIKTILDNIIFKDKI